MPVSRPVTASRFPFFGQFLVHFSLPNLNINVNYIARAYMTLSDIYLGKNELQKADRAIKKALRANKRIKGVREKLKNINKLKLQ